MRKSGAIDLWTPDPRQHVMDDLQKKRHRRALFGRRKGPKLSAHQLELRRTLLPKLILRLEKDRDPRCYFSSLPPASDPVTDVWLEVGYGGGEHLLWQANAHPGVGLIGAEPYISGTAKLLSKLDPAHLPNIRLYEDDARTSSRRCLIPASDAFSFCSPIPGTRRDITSAVSSRAKCSTRSRGS